MKGVIQIQVHCYMPHSEPYNFCLEYFQSQFLFIFAWNDPYVISEDPFEQFFGCQTPATIRIFADWR